MLTEPLLQPAPHPGVATKRWLAAVAAAAALVALAYATSTTAVDLEPQQAQLEQQEVKIEQQQAQLSLVELWETSPATGRRLERAPVAAPSSPADVVVTVRPQHERHRIEASAARSRRLRASSGHR